MIAVPDRQLLLDHRPPMSCTVRLLSLPTIEQLAAAHDPAPAERRELTIVELVDDEGRAGFGECSALTRPGYTPEWARGAFDQLVATRGRQLGPMAAAGVEMARLDGDLTATGVSLAQRLHAVSRPSGEQARPNPPTTVLAGIVLPLASVDQTVAAAARWSGLGVRRLKLKITPGHAGVVAAAVHQACPSVELHVDANGSCGRADLAELASLHEHGVTVIEQPFAIGDDSTTAELTRSTASHVVADESATDLATIIELVEQGVVDGVVIKPGRLGGLANAIQVHDWCLATGVGVSAGGMLESGLGRHALAALASLPGFTIVGDLSPSKRWLAADPFDDLTMRHGEITVPTGPGVAPPPNRDSLDRLTIERSTFDWPAAD